MIYIFNKIMYRSEQKKKSDKVISTVIKAVSTIIVFGVPLIAGTVVMAGYGAYKVFKKLKRQRKF
jgi:hypothetical protein